MQFSPQIKEISIFRQNVDDYRLAMITNQTFFYSCVISAKT